MLRRRWLRWILLTLLALAVFFFGFAPSIVDRIANPIRGHARPVSARAKELHQRLRIADLHADSLLWGRDLLERNGRGMVDLPRLAEGNVALQVFDAVTKTPHGLNIERNDDRSDDITALAIAELWPPPAWFSLEPRALYLAARLQQLAERSQGKLHLIRSREDLARFLEARKNDPTQIAAVLGLEGSQAIGGDLAKLDHLYDAGYRILSPTHFFDTEVGGAAAGVTKGGLTAFGHQWLAHMEERRMIVDLSHASARTIDDVLAAAKRPVIISHTGVRGVCDNNRNLTDAQLDGVARTGGLIGIGYWPIAVCGDDATAIARAIVYTGRRIGFDHVALGSDYDGAIPAPFDVSGVAQVTDALLAAGVGESDIARVMGENVLALLGRELP